MDLQDEVVINGQVFTRGEIVNGVRAMDEASNRPVLPKEDLAKVGLLSRTLIGSPLVSWILPARIRHKDKNDIVFISEHGIAIKELRSDQHLYDVASRTDFNSRIRAAQVLGERRQPSADSITLKSEDQPANHVDEAGPPPQVLVLAMEDHELLFVYAVQTRSGRVTFRYRSSPLPSERSYMEQPGEHLAVDPYSRALAIAACKDTITIRLMKTAQQIGEEFAKLPPEFRPERAERNVHLEGTILKMDFLYPDPKDAAHVILVVIFSKDSTTRISCYDWDDTQGLDSLRLCTRNFSIPAEHKMPVLLIPLEHMSNVLLVTEDGFYLYSGLLTGEPNSMNVAPPNNLQPMFPASSQRLPIFTSWVRPARNYRQFPTGSPENQRDALYLLREDGLLLYITVTAGEKIAVGGAGHLSGNTHQAFAYAHIDWTLRSPDTLLIGGDMSNGEVISIGSRAHLRGSLKMESRRQEALDPRTVEILPNWTPTIDFTLKTGTDGTQANIFATAGRAPYGSITQLRLGLQARMVVRPDVSSLGQVTGLWCMFNGVRDSVLLFVAMPDQTVLMRLGQEQHGDDLELEVIEEAEIERDSETLLAVNFADSEVVQVTRRSVRLLTLSTERSVLKCKTTFEQHDLKISAASFCSATGILLLAIRQGAKSALALVNVNGSPDCLETLADTPAFSSDHDITAILTSEIDNHAAAFVSTADGTIHILRIEDGTKFTLLAEHNIHVTGSETLTTNGPSICDSMVFLRFGLSGIRSLVCGLRNGLLYCIELRSVLASGRWSKTITMGTTPVRVMPDTTSSESAFVLCGRHACRLVLDRSAAVSISSIWFTDTVQPSYSQPAASYIARVPSEHLLHGLQNPLVCSIGSELVLAALDDAHKAVPRHIWVEGTPTRLVYAAYHKLMVVATTITDVRTLGERTSRVTRGLLQWISVDDTIDDAETSHIAASFRLRAAERVHSIINWTSIDRHGKKHAFVLAATGIPSKRTGRVLFLQLSKERDAEGRRIVKMQKRLKFDSEVYAVAEYDENELAICVGQSLLLYQYRTEDQRIVEIASQQLRSPGHQLSCQRPYIHISTASDSLAIYRVQYAQDGEVGRRIIVHSNDSRARKTAHHIVPAIFNNKPPNTFVDIALLSDKAGSVVGIIPSQTPRVRVGAHTLFEAQLPVSTARLRQGPISPLWNSDAASLKGILSKDQIIGSAADGSFRDFRILDEHAWRLLKFLERLIKDSERRDWLTNRDDPAFVLGPEQIMPPIPLSSIDPERDEAGLSQKTAYHIDGDVLLRWLEDKTIEDPQKKLVNLVREAGLDVGKRFKDILLACPLWLDEDTDRTEPLEDWQKVEQSFRRCMVYVTAIMSPVL